MSHGIGNSNRRKFIAGGVLLGSAAAVPYAKLADAIFNSVLRNAYAEIAGAGTQSRNYINVAALGAPCRYAFDQWVRVNNSDPAIAPNPMVATRLLNVGGVYADTAYETFSVNNSDPNGVLVPSFFRASVNTTAGVRPLTDLLTNMMVIRGYGSGIDGHTGNHIVQLMPLNGAPSIAGLAADASSRVFPAVQYPGRGGFTTFSSANGKGLATVGDPALKSLMEPFGPTATSKVRDLKAAHSNTISYYQNRLAALSQSGDETAQALALNATNAHKLISRGIADIDAFWQPAVDRYRNVILQAVRASGIYGVSDLAVVNPSGTSRLGQPVDNLFHWMTTDATGFRVTSPGYDMRSSLATAGMSVFAEGLALAEYLITQNLGGVLEIQIPAIDTLSVNVLADPANTASGQPAIQTTYHDMHTLGGALMVLYTNAMFRAFSAGILELSDQLKKVTVREGANAWQETVVQLTGDFGRVPRTDGSGSDHGYNQMATSLYSGCIAQGPFVVGNVMNGGLYAGYEGTQGMGAPIAGYTQGGRPSPMMMASTVAAMLRVPENRYKNLAAPLIEMVNGEVQYSEFGQGKTVG